MTITARGAAEASPADDDATPGASGAEPTADRLQPELPDQPRPVDGPQVPDRPTHLGPRAVLALLAGRAVRRVLRIVRPGGGTAIPGLVMERLSPDLLGRLLAQPPEGLVVVSGSSGKSTTTSMLVAIVRAHGRDVVTNPDTANIGRGMLSELVDQADWRGRLPGDIAIFEMDEGHAALTTRQCRPRVSVLLNVMVDQLHRWQEPERVAGYLERVARDTLETVVINQDDPQLARIGAQLTGVDVRRVSVTPEVLDSLPNGLGSAPDFGDAVVVDGPACSNASVVASDGQDARLSLCGEDELGLSLPAPGAHIALDAAAAVEGARAVLGADFDPALAARALAELPTVFGRDEHATIEGQDVDFILTKSPSSIQVNLDLLGSEPERVYVAVGRDILDASQLWISDWSALGHADVVSGWQAWDTALRLAYDEVPVEVVEPDLEAATRRFLDLPSPVGGRPKTVIFTPESMRRIRRSLGLTGKAVVR